MSFGLMASCQKLPKFDFQSQFSMSKIIRIFLNLFFIEEYQFRSTFFVIDIDDINFEILLFSKNNAQFLKARHYTNLRIQPINNLRLVKNCEFWSDFFQTVITIIHHCFYEKSQTLPIFSMQM